MGVLSIFIFVIIVYIWIDHFHYNLIDVPKIPLDYAMNQFSTGDLILFKARDHMNDCKIGCYFTHIGVVYIDPDDPKQTPYIFEAMSVNGHSLLPHHKNNGVYLTPLYSRLAKYKGLIYYKQLNNTIYPDIIRAFKTDLIDFAVKNMYYEYDVVGHGAKKGFGLKKYQYGTNCGEITLLSLIKLGLLNKNYFDKSTFHDLRNMCYIEKLNNGYEYYPMIQLTVHPF